MKKIDFGPPLTPPAQFLRVSAFRSLPGDERYHLKPDAEQLLVLVAGRLWWEQDGQVRTAGPGDVVYHPLGQAYLEWTSREETASGCKIRFHWAQAPRSLAAVTRDERGAIRAATDRLLAIWYDMESRGQTPRLRESAHLVFYGLLGELLELNLDDSPPLLRDLRAYVQQRAAQHLTLAELAAHAGYEPSYYVRKFRAQTGQTPMAAARHCRLELARHLLLSTRLPAKTIAHQCGFADGAHLSRQVRQTYHSSIRDLRAATPAG